MIRYRLRCAEGHAFDHWFDNAAACDAELAAAAVPCPECGNTAVAKAIMAPAVGKTASPATPCGRPVCDCGCPALDGQAQAPLNYCQADRRLIHSWEGGPHP